MGSQGAPGSLGEALARCHEHLGRREHSVAELRARLRRAGFADPVAEAALAVVIDQGYLDDRRYAQLLAADRRALDGWGAERIRARLEAAGIGRELIDEVLAPLDAAAERAAADALVRRRCRLPLASDRERRRALGLLVRQGFDSEIAYEAVHAASAPSAGED